MSVAVSNIRGDVTVIPICVVYVVTGNCRWRVLLHLLGCTHIGYML